MCYCEHPKILNAIKRGELQKLGFIAFSIAWSKTPDIKTCPRWCPLRKEKKKMRLIDADKIVYRDVMDNNLYPSGYRVAYMHDIKAMPTIEPEILPIVKEKLEIVKEEKEKAIAEAENMSQSLLMAIFSKCKFLVKFDEFGKSIQFVRTVDESEQTIKINALLKLKSFCESKADAWKESRDAYAAGVRDAMETVCTWIGRAQAQAGEDVHD